ncbi:MAG: hypothetical protein U0359_08060 [Byssovorax sp.]
MPQAPHAARSDARSISQPSAKAPLQSAKVPSHTTAQTELEHTVVQCAAELHTTSHAPQWLASTAVFTSQPLATIASQAVAPTQLPRVQPITPHEETAFGRSHAKPQP